VKKLSIDAKMMFQSTVTEILNYFVTNNFSINYLLSGIDLMLFVGADPNVVIN